MLPGVRTASGRLGWLPPIGTALLGSLDGGTRVPDKIFWPVNFPTDQGFAGAQSVRPAFHCGRAALVPVAVSVSVSVSFSPRRSGRRAAVGVLIGGGHPCVPDSVAHGHALSQPMAALGFCGLNMGVSFGGV